MPGPQQITPAQLFRLIGTPDCPILIDVCMDEDFAADPRLIPGARRQPFTSIDTLIPELTGQQVVVLCQKGRKLSQGAAALLRCEGITAESLEGGNVGWANADLPMIPAVAIPFQPDGGTLWVTRQRPKIDRIACPWLIRRFVDPRARFLFVARDEVLPVAEKFGATPFDVPGCKFTHVGDRCSFDAMLKAFALDTGPLMQLATLVRAADTDRLDLLPEAAGLRAASFGLSRMFRDDLEQLDAGLTLYDAFYRWARDASDETHSWP